MKSVTKSGEIPVHEHYAVLVYTTITVPGYDEGQFESENIVQYLTFSNDEELGTWISNNEKSSSSKKFTALRVTPLKPQITITVKFD